MVAPCQAPFNLFFAGPVDGLHDNPPRRRLPGFHGTGKAARAAWGVPDPGRWPFTSTGGKIMGKESLLDRLLGRGRLVLSRISPVIPELLGEP